MKDLCLGPLTRWHCQSGPELTDYMFAFYCHCFPPKIALFGRSRLIAPCQSSTLMVTRKGPLWVLHMQFYTINQMYYNKSIPGSISKQYFVFCLRKKQRGRSLLDPSQALKHLVLLSELTRHFIEDSAAGLSSLGAKSRIEDHNKKRVSWVDLERSLGCVTCSVFVSQQPSLLMSDAAKHKTEPFL